MKELVVDLDNLLKSGLKLDTYIKLQMIYEERIDEIRQISHLLSSLSLKDLEKELYIKVYDNETVDIEPREKLLDLFKPKNNINFDEFFDAFPVRTVDGRVLRVKDKELSGTLSAGYKRAKKLYTSRVKKQNEHSLAVSVVRARSRSGDTKYMNNIETYIRNKVWEKDAIQYNDDTDNNWDRNIANE